MRLRRKPKYVAVHGVPVPRQLANIIRGPLAASGATLTSCYRGSDPQGARILHKNGHMTQAELYAGWVARRPGFLPANRPGTSTHELRNDGVAYHGPVGEHLAWWQCGMDVDDAHVDAFESHMRAKGVRIHRPYPSGSERHHVNLVRRPPRRLWWGR